jgi:hypothetical protein
MTFESNGIPFIIDNSATCIISNVRLLFVGNMKPKTSHIETVSRDGTETQYCGTIRLELTDDANIKHTCDVPNAIYDPYTNFNILGIPFLGDFLVIKPRDKMLLSKPMGLETHPVLVALTSSGTMARMSITLTTQT